MGGSNLYTFYAIGVDNSLYILGVQAKFSDLKCCFRLESEDIESWVCYNAGVSFVQLLAPDLLS